MKIEQGIEIPPRGTTTGRKAVYPFKEMNIGDSLFIPAKTKHATSRAYQAAATFGKRIGRSFTSRKMEHEGVSGIRIWRTK